MRRIWIMLPAMWAIFALSGCGEEVLDYNDPDVGLFVKQLKAGNYHTKNEKGIVEVPKFAEKDIPALLSYADDLSIIPSFPTVHKNSDRKIRLGECMLWVVESIRLGFPASLGCKMVEANANNYEAIYFLTDEEVCDAVSRYRHWWENSHYTRTMWTIDPCYNEPLCGSGYRWW